jgi:hypothetical protein
MFAVLLAQEKTFCGDDPISRFLCYYWIPIVVLVIVLIIVSRRKKR